MGILTVAVVTCPFGFEGKRRQRQAEQGLKELLESVDTMIVIPNEKLLAVAKDAGFFESFRIADDVLRQGVQGISDIITIPGIINRDFADVKTTMAGMGHAVMGTAVRSGENRAMEAAQAAMASPLLEAGAIDGARGILINITGSSSLKLSEVNVASSLIQSAAHEDANIIFGAVLDEKMGEDVKITVIATGFRNQMPERRERMLSVLEPSVVSIPLDSAPMASVPLAAPENRLPATPSTSASAPVLAPASPPRFLSQDEEEEPEATVEAEEVVEPDEDDGPTYYSATAPSAPNSADAEPERVETDRELQQEEMEAAAKPARPKFAELSEEPAYTPPPSEYVETNVETQPDLEKPTFLRRLGF
jgi:cell division protein FtsZ